MPNVAIDLGYYGYLHTHARRQSDGIYGYEPSLAVWDDYIEDIRDRYRFVLENINGGLDWRVGRVFRWQGATNYYASGFLIEKLDGAGVKTDHEWLVCYAGPRMGTVGQRATLANTFGPATTDYFRTFNGNTTEGFIVTHYNYKALLDSYDIGAGADHAVPTTNPHSNTAGFFPDPVTQGVPYIKGISQGDLGRVTNTAFNEWKHIAVMNWEEPCMTVYMNWDQSSRVRRAWVIGDIFEPYDSTDLRGEGHLYTRPNPNSDWDPGDDEHYAGGVNPRYDEYDDFSVYATSYFSTANQPPEYDQSIWYRDKVSVGAVTCWKGAIKADVVSCDGDEARDGDSLYRRGTGAHMRQWRTAHGRSMKVTSLVSMPWVDGQAPPFMDWPKYPQKKVTVVI